MRTQVFSSYSRKETAFLSIVITQREKRDGEEKRISLDSFFNIPGSMSVTEVTTLQFVMMMTGKRAGRRKNRGGDTENVV